MKTKTLVHIVVIFLSVVGLYYLFSIQQAKTRYNGKWEKIAEHWNPHHLPITPIFFFDKNTGIGINTVTIKKTADGGRNWSPVVDYVGQTFYSLVFTDNRHGWVVGTDKHQKPLILKSEDEGSDWENVTFDNRSLTTINKDFTVFYDICFDRTNNKSWIFGDGGIIEALDEGQNWTISNIFPVKETVISVFCDKSGEVWAIGDNGIILHYQDNWNKKVVGNDVFFTKIKVIDDGVWILGYVRPKEIQIGEKAQMRGVLFRSRDKGQTWEDKTPDLANGLFDIYFDGKSGWLVGMNGNIFQTANGGDSWIKVKSPTENNLLNIFFLNSDNIWIAGERATFLKYQN